jgi:leader peptidase (prepilin peptidase)/N-methyltransferase
VGALLLALGSVLDGAEVLRFVQAAAGGGAWFLLMLVIALAARGGFGFGDVKAALLLGLFVAYQPVLAEPAWFDVVGSVAVAVFLSFFIGGSVAIGLMLFRRADRKREIAFGPAMIVASWVAALWGDRLLMAWLG